MRKSHDCVVFRHLRQKIETGKPQWLKRAEDKLSVGDQLSQQLTNASPFKLGRTDVNTAGQRSRR